MNIEIPQEYSSFMNAQIAAGNYGSYAEIIAAGIEGLVAKDELKNLQAELEEIWQETENGQWISAEESERQFEAFKLDYLARQNRQ